MPRTFGTVESQREQSQALSRRLLAQRLRRNGASEATVIAFTQSRLERYPRGKTRAAAYNPA